MRLNFSTFVPHLVAIGVFLATSIFYFSPQFSGQVIQQGDINNYKGMSNELRQYEAETGEKALWTNAMFGGMPSYQINTVRGGNYVNKLVHVLRAFIPAPAGQFIAAMISFYVLMVLLGVSPWISIIGAITFGFATNNLVLYEAGHMTKLSTISYLPLIASGMLLAFRKRYLLGALMFGIGLGLDLAANHVQMTYYFFLTVIIWGIAELVNNAREGTLPHFAKAAGYLTIGGLLAIGSAASNLLVTYEYSHDTMRGKPILEQVASSGPASSSEVEGLDWSYAMQWSNNTIDLFSSFIPGVAGGGSAQPTTSDSPYGQAMRRLGAGQSGTFDAPLYWGALPFTSGPIYFGAIMVLFFIIGLFLVEGPVKWWLGLGTLLTLLLSMGSNMEGLNRFFFDYFPLFNKFRTPNSVLSVTSFLVPALAVLSLHKIMEGHIEKTKVLRSLYIGGGISLAVALFFALLGPSMFDFANPRDQQMFGQADPQVMSILLTALAETRAELMSSDAWRTFLLVGISLGLIYLFIQEKITPTPVLAGLALLSLIDVFGVGMRYLNKEDFVPASSNEQVFKPRSVDTEILKDPDPYYRVHDATASSFQSSQASYFHKTIGGYHAAKLQRFQDLIDRHLTQGNQQVYNMLNTKYFILPAENGAARIQPNPGAMGNAWFLDSIAIAQSNNEEIDALNTLDLKRVAAIHEEYNDYISGLSTSGAGDIQLTEYRPDQLTYQANTSQEALAVFSEIWYGPNKGWQAYIDGEAVDHIRANYALRALKIPSGQHEIIFKFEPKTFYIGKTVSAASSLVLLLGLLAIIGLNVKNTMNAPEPIITEEKKKTVKAKTAKPKKRKPKK